jgi:glutamate dehydrogenase (NAD(P)+)
MAPDVSLEECSRLVRAMNLKNAAAGLRYGGGKTVIFGDSKMPRSDKERLIRTLAPALRNVEEYVFAPDIGTDEECIGWVRDEIGRVVGLPRELGGIPLDEISATGFGLAHIAEVPQDYVDLRLDGATVAIQGFGAVGGKAAHFLTLKSSVSPARS